MGLVTCCLVSWPEGFGAVPLALPRWMSSCLGLGFGRVLVLFLVSLVAAVMWVGHPLGLPATGPDIDSGVIQ